jgi:hypothetical protein
MALCPQCSSPPITGDLFCRKCGTALVPSAPVVRPPSLQASRAKRPRKPSAAGLITFCVLAAVFLALFFYVRSLATVPSVTSVLEGGRGWYLEPGMALRFELITIIIFGLFFALAIRSVVRLVTRPPAPPVGKAAGSEAAPDAAQRLRDLTSLRNQRLLSPEEYEAKRAEILAGV